MKQVTLSCLLLLLSGTALSQFTVKLDKKAVVNHPTLRKNVKIHNQWDDPNYVMPNSGWFTTPHPEISIYRYWVNWLKHSPKPPAPLTTKEGFTVEKPHTHILKAERKVDFNNVMNFFYIAPLYFGTAVTSM